MPALKIEQYGGMLPAWDPTLLPPGQAAFAKNTYLFSGALSGWRKPTLLRALTNGAARMVYRIPLSDSGITSSSTWLEFPDPDTNVVKSPIVEDQWSRYYFASPTVAPEYNTLQRIQAGQTPWLLGVPPPGCAPSVAVTGGGNNLTLGNFSPLAPDATVVANRVYLVPFTPAGDTQLTSVAFSLSDTAGTVAPATRWMGVLYADNAGVPGALLNVGTVITGLTVTGNESSFLNPSGLTNNTQYWLGFLINAGNIFEGGASSCVQFAQTFTNGPPNPAPAVSAAPKINVWGNFVTSDVVESRAYIYTWVTEYGEEGPPSPPTLLDGWSNGTWTIGLWSPAATDLGVTRNLRTLRLYRTVPGEAGNTVFFFVAEIAIGTNTYVDTNPDSTVALNEQISSTNWFPPPEGMKGLTVLQNGMVCGFTVNEIWFCEPYHVHAWPPAYVLTTDFQIVGLGVTNGQLVVATQSNPYVVAGTTPGQMDMKKCSNPNPCSSRASILSGDGAVSFMSPNGLIQVTGAGVATNTTDLWFTREKWQQLTPPHDARAIFLASCYYCLGSVARDNIDTSQALTGFTIELDQDNVSFSIWPQPGGHRLGFNQLDTPVGFNIQNVLTDPWTGIGLVVANGNVYYFDFSNANPEMIAYDWKSKVYQQNAKRNYQAMKVYFSIPTNTPAQNATRIEEAPTDPVWATLPTDSYGFLKTYADVDGTGSLVLVDCREIRKSGELLRLPSGFKADQWQWEILGRVPISNLQIATSAKELANV